MLARCVHVAIKYWGCYGRVRGTLGPYPWYHRAPSSSRGRPRPSHQAAYRGHEWCMGGGVLSGVVPAGGSRVIRRA